MGMRDALGRGRNVRRRFVGSTFITTAGSFNQTVPAGVDSCDIIAVGASAITQTGGQSSGGGGMAIRRNKSVVPGQLISGSVGDTAVGTAGATIVDGMTANGSSASTSTIPGKGGAATGGDVNLNGSDAPNVTTGGGIASPAWLATPAAPWTDSGAPYIHPLYKGVGATALGSAGSVPGGGARGQTSAISIGATGGVFFFWYVTEAT